MGSGRARIEIGIGSTEISRSRSILMPNPDRDRLTPVGKPSQPTDMIDRRRLRHAKRVGQIGRVEHEYLDGSVTCRSSRSGSPGSTDHVTRIVILAEFWINFLLHGRYTVIPASNNERPQYKWNLKQITPPAKNLHVIDVVTPTKIMFTHCKSIKRPHTPETIDFFLHCFYFLPEVLFGHSLIDSCLHWRIFIWVTNCRIRINSPPQIPQQLHIFLHNGNTLGMYRQAIPIITNLSSAEVTSFQSSSPRPARRQVAKQR